MARYGKRRKKTRYSSRNRRPTRGWRRRVIKQMRKGNIRSGGTLKPELKWFDTADTGTFGTTLVSIMNTNDTLNAIGQGSGASQRIGDKVIIRAIQMRMTVRSTGAITTAEDEAPLVVRVIMIVDHQCNGALPLVADILEDTTDVNSWREMTTTSRFTVLMDKQITMNIQKTGEGATDGSQAVTPMIRQCTFYKKLSMLSQYDAATANAIGSQTNNAILLYGMVRTAAPACTFGWVSRCRYVG